MPEHRSRLLRGAFLGALWGAIQASAASAQAQRRCRVADIAVSPSSGTVRVGENSVFTATAYDATGNPCDNVNFTWSSSNPAFARIDNNGIATGIAEGSAAITARAVGSTPPRSGTAALVVTSSVATQSTMANTSSIPSYAPVPGRPTGPGFAAFDRQPEGSGPADGLFVDPLQLQMVKGEWRAIDYRAVRGTDGQNAARVPILFLVEQGGERIISVDSLGLVTSIGETGVATVRLTVPGQSRIAQKQVRVEVKADSLRFNRVAFSLTPGSLETLSVYIPAQNRPLNNPELFQFRSSDPAIVRVNPVNPIIEALSAGTARIIAESPIYRELSATVHVHPPIASVRLVPADTTRIIAIGGTTSVRVTAHAADGSIVAPAPISWRSQDTAIVSFDSATGQVRGRRSGIATIMVTVPTVREEAITRMVRIRVVAGAMSVPQTRFGMGVGQRRPLEVTLLSDTREPVGPANPYIRSWVATPDTVVRVENGNEIVALKPGRARLVGRSAWDSTVTMDVFVVGDILVTAQNQGRRDLIMKWSSGQNWTPLTNDSLVELFSAWAPDLTRVAFTVRQVLPPNSRTQPGAALYLMQSDGTGRVRVTDDSLTVRFPSFSPTGDRLVFESNRGGRAQVWLASVRGDSVTGARQITTLTPGAANSAPTFSRDGARLAYVSFRETGPGRPVYGIYTSSTDGSDERVRTTAPQGQRLDNPVYAPDGRTLYFLRSESGRPPGQRVWKIGIEPGAADTALPVTPAGMFVSSFSVSGDGTLLALATTETVQRSQQPLQHVMLFNLATGQSQSIDTTPDERPASPTLRPAPPRAASTPPNR